MVLNSLAPSHYVEKIRFCLDYLGADYEEETDIGIAGFILFGRTLPVLSVPGLNITLGNSPDILRYLFAVNYNNEKARRFLEPTEEAVALEKKLDKFASAARRYLVHQ